MWISSEKVLASFVSILISLTFSVNGNADTASRIEEIKKQKQITENRVARYLGDLEAAKESLDAFESTVTKAFLKAKEQPSDETARAATIIAIDYNRRIAKVERMEKRVADNQEKLAEIEVLLKTANWQLAVELKRKKEKPHYSKSDTSPEPIPSPTVYEALTSNQTKTEPKPDGTPPTTKAAEELHSESVEVAEANPIRETEAEEPPLGTWPSYASASEADRAFVKKQLDEAQLAMQKGDKPLLPKVVIRARRSFGTENMNYLGNDLYGLEATISSGHQKFDIFNKKFWLNVPESEDQQRYFFIFDTESLARPKLYAFRISVLD